MNRRQKIIISITGITIISLFLMGLTFGYYLTKISGNENSKSVSVASAKKEVKYTDLGEEVSGVIIEPGYEHVKVFTVQNIGDSEATYHIYLDEVTNTFNRTQDITYTLYRKTGNNTIDTDNLSDSDIVTTGTFPKTNSYILVDEIITTPNNYYTYALKVTYINSNEDQTEDQGKTFSYKVQLHGEIINPYSNNKNLLSYNIINNSINLTDEQKNSGYAEYRTTPLTKVAISEGIVYDKENEFNYETISTSSLSPGYVSWLVGDTSEEALTGSTVSSYSEAVDKYVHDSANGWTKYLKSYDAVNSTVTFINLIVGETITPTPDDYGTSYYYRGNVKNNYLNFNNMCWRIVRIEGDGSTKLILEDKIATCESSTYTGDWSIGTAGYGYTYDYVTNSSGVTSSEKKYVADYLNSSSGMKTALDAWLISSGLDTNKLKKDNWCLGNLTTAYSSNGNVLSSTINDLIYNGTDFYYDTYKRFKGLGVEKYATLRCSGENYQTYSSYIGTLTADEVVFAGGKDRNAYGDPNQPLKYYLLNEYETTPTWKTLSLSDSQDVYKAYKDGSIYSEHVYLSIGDIRPAITLSANTQISGGDGSMQYPYIIK